MTFTIVSQGEADRVQALIDAECRRLGINTLRSRADLIAIPEIAALGTDSAGLPLAIDNHYSCPRCNTTWTDAWSCEVDDDCTLCGYNSSPERSTLRIHETHAQLFELLPETPWCSL